MSDNKISSGYLWLKNLPTTCGDCLEILEPQLSGTLKACPELYKDCFTLISTYITNLKLKRNRNVSYYCRYFAAPGRDASIYAVHGVFHRSGLAQTSGVLEHCYGHAWHVAACSRHLHVSEESFQGCVRIHSGGHDTFFYQWSAQ